VNDTHFPVKGHSEDFKSRTRPGNKGLSWKIQDGWSPYENLYFTMNGRYNACLTINNRPTTQITGYDSFWNS